MIISSEYKLPKDIEPDSAHLIGGYPLSDEIKDILYETLEEIERTKKEVRLSLAPDELQKITDVLKGLSVQQIRNIINHCVVEDNILDIKDLGKIEALKKKIFDREGLLEFCLTEDKDRVAGFDNLKRWLLERKDSFRSNQRTSLPVPKGLLLMGVQGCGKSLAVKVVARELDLPLYR